LITAGRPPESVTPEPHKERSAVKFAPSSNVRGWLGLAVRVVLAAVWTWAAWSKIGNPRGFVQAVRAYDATPEWLSKAIGYGLPVLELSLAVLLLIGLITRYAAAVSAALFAVFLIGISQAAMRGIKIECGCFGGGGQSSTTSYTLDILRDLVLLALAVYLIIWPMSRFSVDEAIVKSEMVPGLSSRQLKSEKNVRRYNAALAAAQTELQHKQRYVAAGTAVAVLLVGLIAIGVQGGRAKISATADATNASVSTGVRVGNTKAPVTVDLYEDLQCPVCKQLESTLGKDLAAKVKATSVKVNYHVISILDRASNGNRYSSRAANAAYCASDVSPDAFVKFHDILYGKDSKGVDIQPAEGSNGRTDSELIAYGKQAGITSADFSTCVTSQQHKDLVAGVTDAASKKGVVGTPTVYVDGKMVGSNGSAPTTDQIDAAIATALSKAKSTAAPSPSASVSPSAPVKPSASASKSASKKTSAPAATSTAP
jgi:protein-disulfide isomerase/uncharacterized membrane protein YphA (DoxX/SURF4 family)